MSQEVEGSVPFMLGQMNGKLDLLINNQAEFSDRLDGHARRIRTLEGYKSWLLGASATVGIIAACIKDWFTK